MCVCEGGGDIVFDLDSVRCEPRAHGIESHYLTEPEPYLVSNRSIKQIFINL